MRDAYRVFLAPIALIGLIHMVGGAAVLLAPQAAFVSQLSGLMLLLGPRPLLVAAGLITVGTLAVTAEIMPLGPRMRVAFIAPQQLVLLIQAVGVAVAAWRGAYPDGYIPVPGDWWASFWFIVGDQAALLLLCLSHTIELFFSGPLGRAHARYAARLAAEREARREAEDALGKYKETEFWIQIGNEFKTQQPEAQSASKGEETKPG
jgi:hypothetical protein